MKKILSKLFFICLLTSFSFAQPKADEFKPEIKVGATLFTGWEFNIDNAEFISKLDTSQSDPAAVFGYKPAIHQFETSRNSFFIERSYINVRASLTPQISARVTPDVFSFTDGTGRTQFMFGLKNAYVNYTPLKKESGFSLGFTVGVIPNLWKGTNERYWGYRGMAKTLTDFEWTVSAVRNGANVTRTTSAYFASADLGLDVGLTAPKGFAELNVDLVNGNGFRNLSFDNRFKDLFATAFFHPLAQRLAKKMEANKKAGKDRLEGIADLTLGGFAYVGKLDKGENFIPDAVQYQRNRFGAMAHFKFNLKQAGFVKIGGEFSLQKNHDPAAVKPDSLVETNAQGLSAYLEFNPPVAELNDKLFLVARYDLFDPNTTDTDTSIISFNNNTDKQSLLLLGLAFKPAKILTLGVNFQLLTYDREYIVKYDGTASKSDGRFFFNAILDF